MSYKDDIARLKLTVMELQCYSSSLEVKKNFANEQFGILAHQNDILKVQLEDAIRENEELKRQLRMKEKYSIA